MRDLWRRGTPYLPEATILAVGVLLRVLVFLRFDPRWGYDAESHVANIEFVHADEFLSADDARYPLDFVHSYIVLQHIPPRIGMRYRELGRFGMLIIFALLFFGGFQILLWPILIPLCVMIIGTRLRFGADRWDPPAPFFDFARMPADWTVPEPTPRGR